MSLGRRWLTTVAITAGLVLGTGIAPAAAFDFTQSLKRGDISPDVAELERRIAGWFPKNDQTMLVIDNRYDAQTQWAVTRFQKHYKLTVDGIAGTEVFEVIERLDQRDGSTLHFDYSEFWQNRSSGCSKRANSFAGTFKGGAVSARWVKLNVTNLMWRLEAIRARGGNKPIGINSGFRSLAYNRCIGGASKSQHVYGTAADTVMAEVTNRRERDLARSGQVYGIGCYATLSHNHFDLRLQNRALADASFWWWPRQDQFRRDLDESARPCHGERKHLAARSAVPATDVLSVSEVEEWEDAGEAPLNGAD